MRRTRKRGSAQGSTVSSQSRSKKRGVTQSKNIKGWSRTRYREQKQRKDQFLSLSGREEPALETPETLGRFDYSKQLGFPGEFPFTRGIQATMYRGRLWTMRQFAGFGTPEDTNRRFKYLLSHGQTGLSTAFDMPALMGYDADHDRSMGEVGREGVSLSTLDDMRRLFDGIDQTAVTTSMTINCTATVAMAMYFALARERNVALEKVGGTIQNDMLKEFIAQKEWICPPAPAVKLVCDVIEYCAEHAPRWNPVSVSGYHIREAGATSAQELAFTIADGIAYVDHCVSRGMRVDDFAPRLSFFFDVHNNFFEEIAKFRAARRIWAKLLRERYRAKDVRSMMLRTHAQTAGVSLTAQQPVNNVVRVALQALAAVLGGVQSLHTNSMDETLALPTEEAVKVALRTQQIIAEESGVADTIDPLGGSYYLEKLTCTMEREALGYIKKIDSYGGMLAAVEQGYPQREIAEAAYQFQLRQDQGDIALVGVNRYADDSDQSIPLHEIDPRVEREQAERCRQFRANRNAQAAEKAMVSVRECCAQNRNVMPVVIDAVQVGVTLGEISDIYRETFGVYRDPGII